MDSNISKTIWEYCGCKQTPHIQHHAHPTRDDSHPHSNFGSPNIYVIVPRTHSLRNDIPVCKEHGYIHGSDGKNDVEPRIVVSCTMSFIVSGFTYISVVVPRFLVQCRRGYSASLNGSENSLIPRGFNPTWLSGDYAKFRMIV